MFVCFSVFSRKIQNRMRSLNLGDILGESSSWQRIILVYRLWYTRGRTMDFYKEIVSIPLLGGHRYTQRLWKSFTGPTNFNGTKRTFTDPEMKGVYIGPVFGHWFTKNPLLPSFMFKGTDFSLVRSRRSSSLSDSDEEVDFNVETNQEREGKTRGVK